MSILAKIFPLNENGASDNYEKFKAFWSQVEGCEVEKIDMKNYTPPRKAEDFKNQLIHLSKTFERGDRYKYLVVAVSSHGIEQEQDIFEKDSKVKTGVEVSLEIAWGKNRYKVNELLKIFEDIKEKQKIFIMQMCRNRSDERTVTKLGRDQGALVHHSMTEPYLGIHAPAIDNQPEELTAGAHGKSQSTEALNSIAWPKTWKLAQPCIRDSIVMFSSPSGYSSYHNKNTPDDAGGWIFVSMEKLLKSLKGEKISVIDLFLMVNQKMSETFTINPMGQYIGLSSFNHMLTQDIFIEFKK